MLIRNKTTQLVCHKTFTKIRYSGLPHMLSLSKKNTILSGRNIVKEPSSDRTQKQSSVSSSGLLDALAVATSAVAGLFASWQVVMRNFENRTMQSMGLTRNIKSIRDKALAKLGQSGLKGDEFIQAEQKLFKDYHAAKDAILEEKAIKGPWKKFLLLDRHGKAETIVAFGAVTALALGTMAAISGLRKTSRQQENLQDRLDQIEQNQQR
jgi:hypothetical protein